VVGLLSVVTAPIHELIIYILFEDVARLRGIGLKSSCQYRSPCVCVMPSVNAAGNLSRPI